MLYMIMWRNQIYLFDLMTVTAVLWRLSVSHQAFAAPSFSPSLFVDFLFLFLQKFPLTLKILFLSKSALKVAWIWLAKFWDGLGTWIQAYLQNSKPIFLCQVSHIIIPCGLVKWCHVSHTWKLRNLGG